MSVTLPSGNLIEYIIDSRNRRIGKKFGAPGATVLQKAWLYKDGLNPIAELDGAGNVTARFVYASRVNVPDFIVVPSGTHTGTYRIISDHLGSPRLIINVDDGSIKESIDYDVWGKEITTRAIGNFPLPFTFAGGLYDSDTKLVRFGARDYDPETGRWTSKDPIRFDGDGMNLYGYVTNDPVNFLDSSGLLSRKAKKALTEFFKDYTVGELENIILLIDALGVAGLIFDIATIPSGEGIVIKLACNSAKKVIRNIIEKRLSKEARKKGLKNISKRDFDLRKKRKFEEPKDNADTLLKAQKKNPISIQGANKTLQNESSLFPKSSLDLTDNLP